MRVLQNNCEAGEGHTNWPVSAARALPRLAAWGIWPLVNLWP
jgi:hypothetical protein